jgi:hypothetical protein
LQGVQRILLSDRATVDALRAAVITALCVLLLGCSDAGIVAAQPNQVEVVDSHDECTKKLAELESKVRALELKQAFEERWEKAALLTPSDEGYSTIRTDLGILTVSLDDVNAYANGSRVTLKFGNLTSATIDKVRMKVEWGGTDEAGVPQTEIAKSREVTLSNPLQPASWNKATVVLDGTPPTALGFVRVSEVKHSGIRLR